MNYRGYRMQILPIEDLISAVVILIAAMINLIIGIKSYRSYRGNKLTQTILFGFTAFFMALAMLLLIAEKLFLSPLISNGDLGMAFGLVAITVSGFAVISVDAFSFNMVFPDKFKVLTILAACVEAVYLIAWYVDPARTVAWADGSGEIVLGSFTEILPYFTLVPLLIIPIGVFFYYALKVRAESPVSSKRSWTLGFGVLAITIGFVGEIVGLDPTLPWAPPVIVIARSLFIVGAFLLYWGLFRIKAK